MADPIAGPSRLHDLFQARPALDAWLVRWRERAVSEPMAEADRIRAMRQTNPLYIPRNHQVEIALEAAREGDLEPFERLLAVITHPFEERSELADYAMPASAEVTANYQTFCGT